MAQKTNTTKARLSRNENAAQAKYRSASLTDRRTVSIITTFRFDRNIAVPKSTGSITETVPLVLCSANGKYWQLIDNRATKLRKTPRKGKNDSL